MNYFNFSNSINDIYIQKIIYKCCENIYKMKILYKDNDIKKLVLPITSNNHIYHIILEHTKKSDIFYFTDKNINKFNNKEKIYEEEIIKFINNKDFLFSNALSFNAITILMKHFQINEKELSEKTNNFRKEINSIIQGLFIDYNFMLNILTENKNDQNKKYEDNFEQNVFYENENRIVLSKLDGLLFIMDNNNDDINVFVQNIDLLSDDQGYKKLNKNIINKNKYDYYKKFYKKTFDHLKEHLIQYFPKKTLSLDIK